MATVVHIPLLRERREYDSESEYDSELEDSSVGYYMDPMLCDNIDAAYEDAKYAILNCDIDRARVVLNRYEQFTNFENELMEMLCSLGNGPLLVDYLSISERSIEYAAAPNGYTAIAIARDVCEDDELVKFLQKAIDDLRKSQDDKLMAFLQQAK